MQGTTRDNRIRAYVVQKTYIEVQTERESYTSSGKLQVYDNLVRIRGLYYGVKGKRQGHNLIATCCNSFFRALR